MLAQPHILVEMSRDFSTTPVVNNRRFLVEVTLSHCKLHKMSSSTETDNKPFLVYQLGTNNWQREGEFAPGR